MKCDVCGSKIEVTFLSKINGTIIRDAKRKKRTVCSSCQSNGKIKELVA